MEQERPHFKNSKLWLVLSLVIAIGLIVWLTLYFNPRVELGFANVYIGQDAAGHPDYGTKIIDNQTDLNAFLDSLYPDDLPPSLAHLHQEPRLSGPSLNSSVDFDNNVVLVLFAGTKPTGGYSIDIDRATARFGRTDIYITETSPGQNCLTTQQVTHPWRLMLLERTGNKLNFIKSDQTRDCS